MNVQQKWRQLGWRHTVWDLVRYYCSFGRAVREQDDWLNDLVRCQKMQVGDGRPLPIAESDIETFQDYLMARDDLTETAVSLLRTEKQARGYCKTSGLKIGTVATRNLDHHQSPKAMVAAATAIAEQVCKEKGITIDSNPQRRCAWCTKKGLHVTARNLDGAIPGLANPAIIWEIKEYWGVTSGGSKMSDAVYECNLVGRELREFEERTKFSRVRHVVLLDGKDQWHARRSDLTRFIDLFCQGIVDELFVGKDVETEWRCFLETALC